jgi:hypothetical protein
LQGSPKPILLHAASEIEKDLVVTKVYQQLNLQNTAKKVFFKADIDTLHVISSSQLSGHLAPLSTPAFSTGMDLAKVRHLTFNLTVFQDNFNEALQIINSVDSLESLKIQGYVWAVQDALVWVQFRDVNLDGQVIVPLYQTTHNQLQGQNAIDHIGRALQIQGEQDRLEELWAIMTHVGQHTTNLPQYVDLEIQYGA